MEQNLLWMDRTLVRQSKAQCELPARIWSGLCWHDGQFYESRKYPELEILDRIGGGDGFASGLMYGFLSKNDPQAAVDYGAAHGAHASTTPGDTSMATRAELDKLIAATGSSVAR